MILDVLMGMAILFGLSVYFDKTYDSFRNRVRDWFKGY